MKRVFVCFLLGVFPCLHAVENLRLPDIRCIGMGGCGATQSLLFNPSLVCLDHVKSVDINYFNKYGLKELGTVSLAVSIPNELLSTGVNISSFGYDRYRESMFRFFVGKSLTDKWSAGISIQYSMLQTEMLEERPQYLSVDVGVVYSPVEKLLVTLLIMDLPSVAIKKEITDIETIIGYSLQVGFQWEVINNLLIAGTAETNKQTTLTGSVGIEYQLLDHFKVRAGIKATPLLPSLGVGYRFGGFTVDVATVYHPILGMSTGVGLKYSF